MSLTPITSDNVLALAPELATGTRALTPQAWDIILSYVNGIDMTQGNCGGVSVDTTTDRTAKILLAAHMGTLIKKGNSLATGPMTSESMGDVRRSFGMLSSAGTDGLGSTKYGLLYQQVTGASLKALFLVV